MSTETTNKKIKIDNGTTFGRTYTDKAIDAKLPTDLIASANKLSLGVGNAPLGSGVNLSGFTYDEATKTLKASGGEGGISVIELTDKNGTIASTQLGEINANPQNFAFKYNGKILPFTSSDSTTYQYCNNTTSSSDNNVMTTSTLLKITSSTGAYTIAENVHNVVANSIHTANGGDLTNSQVGSKVYSIPSGGGSSGFNILTKSEYTDKFVGNIETNAINVLDRSGDLIIENYTKSPLGKIVAEFITLELDSNREPSGNLLIYIAEQTKNTKKVSFKKVKLRVYSHFITLTNNTSSFYFTYQNTSEQELKTFEAIKTALAGKFLICTGHTDSDIAEYISGNGENIVVGVVNKSGNSTSGITINSSFTISDLVTPVV